jgi:polygalacturonase
MDLCHGGTAADSLAPASLYLDRRRLLLGGGALLSSGLISSAAEAKARTFLPGGVLDVLDYGAKGDGKSIDSPAIDRAIDDAAKRGGGTIYFPPGTYASYTIHLKSRVTLFLSRGAVLLAATVPLSGLDSGGYDRAEPQNPAIEPFQDYGHNHWRNSLIYGENLRDIAILGDGLIWGKGLSRGHGDPELPKAELPGVGNKSIALKNCTNVQLRDISILKGGHFALLATGVDNLTIDNLTIDTDRDGLDIDCCRNVRVSNCTINSPYDDAIVPKSSFALGYPRATENVTITNCYVSGSYAVGSVLDRTYKLLTRGPECWLLGRIKCGTESNGGFKNITISNCVFEKCWGLALETVDGAVLEDIAISNITMRDCISAPIFLRLGRRMRGPKGSPVGSFKRVLIDNITCTGNSQFPIIIAGVQGHPVEDVKISNLFVEQAGGGDAAMAALMPPLNEDHYPDPDMFGPLPTCGAFIRNARNIEISHFDVQVKSPDLRPGFWLQDVEGFDGSFLNLPAGVPNFTLNQVSGFRTFGSRSVPDKRYDRVTTTRF